MSAAIVVTVRFWATRCRGPLMSYCAARLPRRAKALVRAAFGKRIPAIIARYARPHRRRLDVGSMSARCRLEGDSKVTPRRAGTAIGAAGATHPPINRPKSRRAAAPPVNRPEANRSNPKRHKAPQGDPAAVIESAFGPPPRRAPDAARRRTARPSRTRALQYAP
ncbi:hypothetical protein [Paraburkholderia sp. J41]|uniref:hypothetical protein n=1 Tax=Paraburkholderia sp. J41 TaxID=2805433 RepID=UPI002AC35E5E|nr:hypothetical protein [Paraburkholderia sp. J41]